MKTAFRNVLLVPLVLAGLFYAVQIGLDGGQKEKNAALLAKQAAELQSQKEELKAAKHEGLLHKNAAAAARSKLDAMLAEAARTDPTPMPTSDQNETTGVIEVTAAAGYCNCPVLVNDGDAAAVLKLLEAGSFARGYPTSPGDPQACLNLTDAFANECNGKASCVYTIKSGEEGPVSGCQSKVSVDYSCSGQPLRHADVVKYQKGSQISLRCDEPRKLPEPMPQVGFVKPVRYEHGGAVFDTWPVGFSVPGHRFVGSIQWKDRDFADMIPGNPTTYKHQQQGGKDGKSEPDSEYFHQYRHAYYCVTRKKKGWDALRHYEILASGCVPYFVDIERMPAMTMVFFPKDLVLEAMRLPGVKYKDDQAGSMWYRDSFEIDFKVFNKTRYYELASRIHDHAKRHLTSEAMASYILKVLAATGGPQKPKTVLYINHCYHDFMGDSLWSGLKELEVKGQLDKVDDVVPPKELSIGGPDGYWAGLHGRGNCVHGRKVPLMSSTSTLERRNFYDWVNGWGNHRSHNYFSHESAPDPNDIPAKIEAKEYDVIIYATPGRTQAWIDLVEKHYPPSAVAILSGADNPEDVSGYMKYSKKGRMFVRELFDAGGVRNDKLCWEAPGITDTRGLGCCQMEDAGARIMWSTNKKDNARWVACAKEDQFCECETVVRFGNPGGDRWSVLDLKKKNTTKVRCHNQNAGGPFPDPAVGMAKVCQCQVPDGQKKT